MSLEGWGSGMVVSLFWSRCLGKQGVGEVVWGPRLPRCKRLPHRLRFYARSPCARDLAFCPGRRSSSRGIEGSLPGYSLLQGYEPSVVEDSVDAPPPATSRQLLDVSDATNAVTPPERITENDVTTSSNSRDLQPRYPVKTTPVPNTFQTGGACHLRRPYNKGHGEV